MTPPRLSQLAARLIAREAEASPARSDQAERSRSIAVVELALRRRARRVLGRALMAVAAAAAVVVASTYRSGGQSAAPPLVAGSSSAEHITPPARIAAHPRGAGAAFSAAAQAVGTAGVVGATLAPLDDGSTLPTGSRVSTPAAGGAELDVTTGTQLLLDERTDLAIMEEGPSQRFALAAGALDAHVAKLGATERFVVRTPDAEVEVRGTRFRVSVVDADPDCGGGSVTRVVVTEGLVAVRHAGAESLVAAGASWPATCAPAPAASSVASPAPVAAPSATPSSTLAAENALFARAMAAKQRGAAGEAVADLDRLVSSYPAGPLAESAAAERMRLLRSLDPRRGADAAREYLRRYPSGFARAEAEALVGGSP